MEYEPFFGFKKEPFADTPDPTIFYSGPEHTRALVKLLHIARRNRGLGILTGKIGCGKTTLSRKILNELKKDGDFLTGLMILTHPNFDVDWFVMKIAELFGIDTDSGSRTEISVNITNFLYSKHRDGKKSVLIIDEANNIVDPEVLEELRGLLNLELVGSRLISIILTGMPELLENLKNNPSLYQRISSVIKLSSLSSNSAKEYIKFRIKQSGVNEEIFTSSAIESIYKHSNGVPRVINVIADNSLLEGAFLKKKPIDEEIIERICEEMGL